MGEGRNEPRPWLRLLFWEGLAGYGLAHVLQYSDPKDPAAHRYLYNACVFLAAYPLLAFWRWTPVPGMIRFLLFPLGWLLRIALFISTYLWFSYVFHASGNGVFHNLMHQRVFLFGLLYFLLYSVWVKHMLGLSGAYHGLGDLLRLNLCALGGSFIGFLIGQGLNTWLTAKAWPPGDRFTVWLVVALLCMILGAWFGQSRGGKKKED